MHPGYPGHEFGMFLLKARCKRSVVMLASSRFLVLNKSDIYSRLMAFVCHWTECSFLLLAFPTMVYVCVGVNVKTK